MGKAWAWAWSKLEMPSGFCCRSGSNRRWEQAPCGCRPSEPARRARARHAKPDGLCNLDRAAAAARAAAGLAVCRLPSAVCFGFAPPAVAVAPKNRSVDTHSIRGSRHCAPSAPQLHPSSSSAPDHSPQLRTRPPTPTRCTRLYRFILCPAQTHVPNRLARPHARSRWPFLPGVPHSPSPAPTTAPPSTALGLAHIHSLSAYWPCHFT